MQSIVTRQQQLGAVHVPNNLQQKNQTREQINQAENAVICVHSRALITLPILYDLKFMVFFYHLGPIDGLMNFHL